MVWASHARRHACGDGQRPAISGVSGIESICRHGVAWYASRLGGELVGGLARDDGRDLPTPDGEFLDLRDRMVLWKEYQT